MAYSGYWGYFIGLSALKRRLRWLILGLGNFSAWALHALSNASVVASVLLGALVGVLSYAFLVAAILKARALSPNREQNFATRIFSQK
jgi:RsiW-degrading membrane proteinase PrsW (M82 family)